MIRRDPTSTGIPTHWILISQIDHAHLAGRLAEHWGADPFVPLVPRDPLLWAIHHHDDGWREWEASPDVDRSRGRPRSFTEMEIDDSLTIWGRSIAIAAVAGPMEAYVVAGHFCALARRVAAWKNGDPRWPAVERFLADNKRSMDDWLRAWQAGDPAARPLETACQALSHLQFFDALSLWFCCAPPSGIERVQPPGGPELTLTPRTAECIDMAPWPFRVKNLNLEIPARIVPAAHYASRDELAAAPSQSLQLRWELQPEANRP